MLLDDEQTVAALIIKAEVQGGLVLEDIYELVPDLDENFEQIERIMAALEEAGVRLTDTADDDDDQVSAEASESVAITDVLPGLTVTKTASPSSVTSRSDRAVGGSGCSASSGRGSGSSGVSASSRVRMAWASYSLRALPGFSRLAARSHSWAASW